MRRPVTHRAGRRVVAVAASVALAWTAAGCGEGSGDDEVLTVYAAASLASTFEEIADRFEETHDGVTVELGLAGSSDLAAQITGGAPADVFASADLATMRELSDEGLVGSDPEVFATNALQIAVPPDNRADVSSLADLARDDLAVVVCAPAVPCGAAALAVAEEAGTTLSPDSEEQSVSDVLGKVRSGEADAGLVYVTDVLAADGDVLGIDVPEAASVVNEYPLATVAGSDQPALAQEFVDLVLGQVGRQVLAEAGFGLP